MTLLGLASSKSAILSSILTNIAKACTPPSLSAPPQLLSSEGRGRSQFSFV